MVLELAGKKTSSAISKANIAPDTLPIFSAESLRAIKIKSSDGIQYYTVNLLEYTCTCPAFEKDHAQALPQEFGRMCKHICFALEHEKLTSFLPPIAQAMVNERHGICAGKTAYDLNGNLIYVTRSNSAGWLNVFALPRKNSKKYSRFGYNINEARWAYGIAPKIDPTLLPPPLIQKTENRNFGNALFRVFRWIAFVVFKAILAVVMIVISFVIGILFSKGKSRHR